MEIKNIFKKISRNKESRKIILKKKKIKLKSYFNYGFDYFDNKNSNLGYGGYRYDKRFISPVKKLIKKFLLNKTMIIAELGCAKGYLIAEFVKEGFDVIGFEKSHYAIEKSHSLVKKKIIKINNIKSLRKYKYDFLICKDVLPNLTKKQIKVILKICAEKKIKSYFVIQTATISKNLDLVKKWDLTHKTILSKEGWKKLLKKYDKQINYSFNYIF
jgi:2-polyprenyl-3-methyl-5-hydroxy-6-metoxy-1,4-benzoquinol methylase